MKDTAKTERALAHIWAQKRLIRSKPVQVLLLLAALSIIWVAFSPRVIGYLFFRGVGWQGAFKAGASVTEVDLAIIWLKVLASSLGIFVFNIFYYEVRQRGRGIVAQARQRGIDLQDPLIVHFESHSEPREQMTHVWNFGLNTVLRACVDPILFVFVASAACWCSLPYAGTPWSLSRYAAINLPVLLAMSWCCIRLALAMFRLRFAMDLQAVAQNLGVYSEE